MSVAVVSPPAPFVSLALAKKQLRVEAANTDEDDLVQLDIAAACASIDGPPGWLGRSIGQQTLELTVDGFWTGWSGAPIALPFGPVVSITSVTYDPPAGSPVVLDQSAYVLAADGVYGAPLATWPAVSDAGRAVRIRYVAGYPPIPAVGSTPETSTVPAPLTAAALLMVGDLYANREASVIEAGKTSVVENPTVAALLAPFRVYR